MKSIEAGTEIAGRYRLQTQLGAGGMGSVWRAEHLSLHSAVAIKLMDPSIASTPDAMSRFMREAHSAAALRSPHVVQIFDYGNDDGLPFIAMELLDGESLADRLSQRGRLTPSETAQVMVQVARAVGKAHDAGIVHRDLKPDNIFIVRNDDEEVVKVLDFGIAKATGPLGTQSGTATRTGALLGTPYYMSPEQAEGTKSVDHRSDIWSMSVIAYECVIGRRPFDSDALGGLLLAICTRPLPIPSQFGIVPPGFDEWFARGAARDPAQRFQSAKEAAAELRRVSESDASRRSGADLRTASVSIAQAGPTAAVVPATTLGASANSVMQTSRGTRSLPAVLAVGGVLLIAALTGLIIYVRHSHAQSTAAAAASAEPKPSTDVGTTPAMPSVQVTPAPPAVPSPNASAEAAPSASAASSAVVVSATLAAPPHASKPGSRHVPGPGSTAVESGQSKPSSRPNAAPPSTPPTKAPAVNLGI